MQIDINHIQHYFFIGVAGTGMSALAQYLSGINKQVSGSDREFKEGKTNVRRTQLEAMNIQCFSQDASGITEKTQLIIASTAIESSNPEIQKAKALGIPLVNRSDLLNAITRTRKTIAVAGTSGKSTTVGMIFHILHTCNLSPSLITGAGISSLKTKNRIGNAYVGSGEWLVIEADESDGSLVKYHPEVGLILNVDKDHKELTTLHEIFGTFHSQIKDCIITNTSHPETLRYSTTPQWDFGLNQQAGYQGKGFKQQGFEIQFRVKHVEFRIPTLGKHNMENALAAIAVAQFLGLSLGDCAYALRSYPGIHRRHQIVGRKKGVWLIDDYAHNPAKLAAAMAACQPIASKLIAWFQPHGFGPTRFLRKELVQEIAHTLREQDEIWMSEIYYAGGTTTKDISANDLIQDLKALGKNAFFVENRTDLAKQLQNHLTENAVVLLMGARDASLDAFAHSVFHDL